MFEMKGDWIPNATEWRHRFAGVIWIAIPILWCATASAQSVDSATDQLESYLLQHNLNRLLIRHLENQVETETNDAERLRKATRLIQLYSDGLFRSQLESKAMEDWSNKAQRLLQIYPQLQSPQFTVAKLQSQYLGLERHFREWIYQPDQPREELLEQWKALSNDLQRFNASMEARFRELLTAVQATAGDPESSRKLNDVENALLHSSFLSGWTAYFMGVLDFGNRQAYFELADEQFRDFLQIEQEKSLNEISLAWFDFESAWHVRAVIGLAMCQQGMGHQKQSDYCFEIVEQNGTPPQLALLPIWKLNSRIFVGELRGIDDVLDEVSQSGQSRRDRKSEVSNAVFWETVLKSSLVVQRQNPAVSHRLQQRGLAGLTGLLQADTIKSFLSQYPIELPDDFYGNWVTGYLKYVDAGSEPESLVLASHHLRRALEKDHPNVARADSARCRYLLARVHYRQREFQSAAALFQQVSAALETTDAEMAAESQWLAVQSLIELARGDQRKIETAFSAIEILIRRFPGSRFVVRAEFEKLRLNLESLPGEAAIARLQEIRDGDPKYGLAVDEIVRMRYQIWANAFHQQAADQAQCLNDLIEAESLARQTDAVPLENKLKLRLLVIDAMLKSTPFRQSQTLSQLRSAGSLAEQISNQSVLYDEFRYYQFAYFQQTGNDNQAMKHANWLAQNSKSTRYEVPALIYLGQMLESRIVTSSSPDTELLVQKRTVYRRLVDILGTSEEQLTSSRNAEVALSKLGHVEQETGNLSQAERVFQLLVDCFPDRLQYLLELARTRSRMGQHRSALPLWQRLGAGASPGSERWYEAKYHVINCLLESDPDSAVQVFRQFKRLVPEIPETWQTRYDELEAKIDKIDSLRAKEGSQ